MKRPKVRPSDEPIGRLVKGGLWSAEPPAEAWPRLLAAAAAQSHHRRENPNSPTRPGWTSLSIARPLLERRMLMQGLKHGYIASALNYRLSW